MSSTKRSTGISSDYAVQQIRQGSEFSLVTLVRSVGISTPFLEPCRDYAPIQLIPKSQPACSFRLQSLQLEVFRQLDSQAEFNLIWKLNKERTERLKERLKKKEGSQNKEKDKIIGNIKRNQQIIEMIKQNFKNSVISKHLRVPVSRVKTVRYRDERGESISKTRGKGRPLKLSQQHLDFIHVQLNSYSSAFLTLKQLRFRFLAAFPELNILSLQTLGRTLHRCGYSYKRTSSHRYLVNSEQTLEKRKEYVEKILPYLNKSFMDVYIDECSFNVCGKKYYAWGPKGLDRKLSVPPKSENITLIAAICRWGILGFCVFIGSVKSDDFAFFVANLVGTLRKKRYFERYVLIFDSASTHFGGNYCDNLMKKINILRLPPYSPF